MKRMSAVSRLRQEGKPVGRLGRGHSSAVASEIRFHARRLSIHLLHEVCSRADGGWHLQKGVRAREKEVPGQAEAK